MWTHKSPLGIRKCLNRDPDLDQGFQIKIDFGIKKGYTFRIRSAKMILKLPTSPSAIQRERLQNMKFILFFPFLGTNLAFLISNSLTESGSATLYP
jgi:hypothetical protein